MRIPPYWARGRYTATSDGDRPQVFTAFGWSFSSAEEAAADAESRARRAFEAFSQKSHPRAYEYLDRPLREEVLEDIAVGDALVASITRNRYGALVLNSARVLFADVDFSEPHAGLVERLRLVFSARRRQARAQAAIDETLARVEGWARRNPSRSFRLYRTREGLRLLFTDRLYDPAAAETTSLLNELGTDPMYVRLTRNQQCFRARLTAKPWRCGCARAPGQFPWADASAERVFRDWEAEYIRKQAGFRACALQSQFGRTADIREIALIVQAHDAGARITSDAPLA